ncbi:MAG: proP [Rhodospirillales bacterium]|nr:proP [Rhodospirillales bacterium]
MSQARSREPAALQPRSVKPAVVVAAVLGNAFEFFDFTVYGVFAVMIGRVFFPVESEFVQILLSLGTFGVGFLTRPLGSIVFGAYADRAGRKPAMMATIWLMAFGTGILGLTPSYAAIGLAAPLVIVVARMIQGFAAGGEVGAATAYLLEVAPEGRRGFFGGWQFASQGLAVAVGGLIGALLSASLTPAALQAWGWRVPFLLGILIAPVGGYIRMKLKETHVPPARPQSMSGIVANLAINHRAPMIAGCLLTMAGTISAYCLSNYMTTYAIRTLHLPTTVALSASLVSGLSMLIFSPIGGVLSDRIGRRPVIVLSRVLLLAATYPAFWLMTSHPSKWTLWAMVALLPGLNALGVAVSLVFIPESMPPAVRASGLAILYAVTVAVFGGSAQSVVTWLIGVTGDPIAPAYYVLVANLIALGAPFLLKETARGALMGNAAPRVPLAQRR